MENGIEKYRFWMSKQNPSVEIVRGVARLKIYRGLQWDQRESEPTVDLLTGCKEDWSPIQAFAEDYAHPGSKKELVERAKKTDWRGTKPWTQWLINEYDPAKTPWALLSSTIPLECPSILKATIHDQMDLDEEDWGDYDERPVTSLTDALMIYIKPINYQFIEGIEIIGTNPLRPIKIIK